MRNDKLKEAVIKEIVQAQPPELEQKEDGCFYMNGKLYVPATLREGILQLCHDSKLSGDFGFLKTLHLLQDSVVA